MKKGIASMLKSVVSCILKAFGVVAITMIVLAFTDLPYYAYHQLSLSDQQLEQPADAIVIMGGDGMPSPNGLMRAYFGAKAAKMHASAKVIIAMPYNKEDSTQQLRMMAEELVGKGIDSNRIIFEPNGFNTRSQAVEVANLISLKSNILIVSSPDHLFRAIRCFEKVGFKQVGSLPTFEVPSDEEKLKDKTKKKDKRVRNLSLRYNLWSYLQYEIKVLREYAAISYYWVKGWI